jgi:hypothetical protein
MSVRLKKGYCGIVSSEFVAVSETDAIGRTDWPEGTAAEDYAWMTPDITRTCNLLSRLHRKLAI